MSITRTPLMMKISALFFIGLLCWSTAYAVPPNAAGVVLVGTAYDVSRERFSTGFVADGNGHMIASIKRTYTKLFVHTSNGTIHIARMVAYDGASKLALLKVEGDTAEFRPYAFAQNPAEIQRKVFGINASGGLAQGRAVAGTLAEVRQSDSDTQPTYYLHNALVGETGEGGPLFNNCGEVVGVIVPRSAYLNRLFSANKEGATAFAVPIEWLIDQFGAYGMAPVHVAATCLSGDAQLREKERRASEAAVQAETAQTQRDAAAQAASVAQNKLNEAQAQLAQAQNASEEERRRLQAEVEARKQEVATAQDREAAAQQTLEASQLALQSAQQAIKETQKKLRTVRTWGIAGAAVLLILLLMVWMLRRRAVLRAKNMQANLTAREQDEARIRQTPTVFFEGGDATGQKVALRIPGASIAADFGTTVGRNPADSDFVINHPEVSRRQFRLFTEQSHIMIEDLGSTNGTVVDGNKLNIRDDTVLADNSSVEISSLVLSVCLEHG